MPHLLLNCEIAERQSPGLHQGRVAFQIDDLSISTRELIAVMPMTRDAEATDHAYRQLATGITGELDRGHDVVFLCEGDAGTGQAGHTHHEREGNRVAELGGLQSHLYSPSGS